MNAPLALSRPLATAATLGDLAPDRHRFHTKRVLLTGASAALHAPNGRVMLLTALRLLPRICSNVEVVLGDVGSALRTEVEAEADRLSFNGSVSVHTHGVPLGAFDAMLFIGNPSAGFGDLSVNNAVAITANGWLVHVSTGMAEYATPTRTNPAAAIAAASLGVTEIFKQLLPLNPRRGAPARGVSFSLYSFESGTSDLGPDLPNEFIADTLVVGVGAIGNGVIGVLRELPIRGRIAFIDRQKFAEENLGTCLLVDRSHVNRDKAKAAVELFGPHHEALELLSFAGEVADILKVLPFRPVIVLNALDNPDARRVVQSMWADLTIDGAIGEFMCQVSRHPGDPSQDVACLRCLYEPETGPSAEKIAAMATGLSIIRASQMESFVTEVDVTNAPAERQEWLRFRLGQQICSVVSAATTAAISQGDQTENFEPSVPFVATMSAAMMVGEWMKSAMGLESTLAPRFQFDVLWGPELGIDFPEGRRVNCDCVQRRETIEAFREAQHEAV